MLPALVAAYGVLGALFVMIRIRRRRVPSSLARIVGIQDDVIHSDNQNSIIAYLFGLQGMTQEVEHYLIKGHDSAYWSESDRIAALAVQAKDEQERNARKRVLYNLLAYASIAPSSTAIIHYNIARVAKVQGREKECEEHLELAKKELPQLMETRMKLDPVFAAG